MTVDSCFESDEPVSESVSQSNGGEAGDVLRRLGLLVCIVVLCVGDPAGDVTGELDSELPELDAIA